MEQPFPDPEEAPEEKPAEEEQKPTIERFALDLIERMRPSIETMADNLDIFIDHQRDLPWSLRKDMKLLLEQVTEREKKIWLNKNNKLAKEQEAVS